MVDNTCLICFDEIDGNIYSCADKTCSCKTCLDCTEALISFSYNEKKIPDCPVDGCNSVYTIDGLKGISDKSIDEYRNACLEFFLRGSGDKVSKIVEKQKMLHKLREEKKKFIKDKFPAAIALIASITFSSRVNKLEKQKAKNIQAKLEESKRRCMVLTCTGFLNDSLKCMSCSAQFCERCEKVKEGDHVCRQEDIDTIDLIKSMIKCPKCMLPVFKNGGCDSITCSNCGTYFVYSTGKMGGSGSVNEKITIRENMNIASEYDYLPAEIVEKLSIIQNKKPKEVSKDSILIPLKYYFKTNKYTESAKKLAKKISTYYTYLYKNKYYQKRIIHIEKILGENKSHEDILREIDKVLIDLDDVTFPI